MLGGGGKGGGEGGGEGGGGIFLAVLPKPSKSQTWLICNFSLYHLFIIQQTGNENTQTYQIEVVLLM